MTLPFKIVRNKPIPKIERKLPLIHIYTFKSGESIYTYDDNDLGNISNRYIKWLSNNLKHIEQYGVTKEVHESWDNANRDLLNQWSEGKRTPGDVLKDLQRLFDAKKEMHEFSGSLWQEQFYSLFCMFFVLDGENELQFSPKENDRKVELLKDCTDQEQEFFFHLLKERLTYYQKGLKSDLASYIAEVRKEAQGLESLNSLTEQNSLKLQRVSSQGKATRPGLIRSALRAIVAYWQLILLKMRDGKEKKND